MTIGFTEKELAAYDAALRVLYRAGEYTEQYVDSIGPRERTTLARHAIWAFCKAIVRHGEFTYPPMACDVRQETPEETAERLGERVPEACPFSPERFRDN